MVQLTLYQSGKLDVQLDFPSEWNDLRPEEVIFVAKILLAQREETIDETRPELFKFFVENRAKKELPKDWFFFLDFEQVVISIFPNLNFIYDKNDLTTLPEPKKIKLRNYYPVDFVDLTCGEFEDCEVQANQFAEAPSGELLAKLAAILFRPKMINGKIEDYMKFNYRKDAYHIYQYEKKAKLFLTLPPEELYAIFIWYSGCRSFLPQQFPDVYNGGGSAEPDMLAFTKCIHSGAGVKNGSREKIRVTKLYEYMFEMNEEARKAAEEMAEMARINSNS